MAPSYLRGLWFEQTWIYIPKDTSTQVTDFLANLFLRREFWWIFLYTFQLKNSTPIAAYSVSKKLFQSLKMSSFWLHITCESRMSSNYIHKRKSCRLCLWCYVCDDKNSLDVPTNVTKAALFSTNQRCARVRDIYPDSEKSVLILGNNWLRVQYQILQCVLFDVNDLMVSENAPFNKYIFLKFPIIYCCLLEF